MPAMGNAGKVPEYSNEYGMSLRDYGNAIWRRKWVLVAIFLAAVTAAVVFSSMVTPIYEATTTIMVQEDKGTGQFSLFDALGAQGKNTNQNYVEMLKSRTVAQQALARLGYDHDIHSPQFAAFRSGIGVQLVNGTDAIQISVLNADPQMATDIANSVVDTFMDMNQSVNTQEARSARSFIEEQLKAVESDLHKAEDTLRKYKEQQKVVAPSEEAKATLEQLSDLGKLKAESSVAITQIQHQLIELRKKLKAEAPTTVSATTISNNPMVLQYKGLLLDLESQLTALSVQYNQDYPRVASLQAEINSVRQKLSKEVERIVSAETTTANPNYQALLQQVVSLEVESVAQQARQAALQKQVAGVEKSLSSLPAKEVQLTRLIRNQSVLEQVYLTLKEKSEEYRITEAIKAAGVSVVDRAVSPIDPVKPRKSLNVGIAGFLGLLVGIALILVLEFFDTTLKTTDDVERILGLPIVGSIPEFDLTTKSGQRGSRKLSQR